MSPLQDITADEIDKPLPITSLEPLNKIYGRSLADYAEQKIDETKTLLGKRFLCREGALLLVGPSGIGKSSASVQQDILWSLGREAFGIIPTSPLRICCIQAENDDGDMTEMSQGILDGLKIDAEDRNIIRRNTFYVPHKTTSGDSFIKFLGEVTEYYRPDIIRIDPLQAFLGADPKDTEMLTKFIRNQINPLLESFNCACIINCHTPKTNFRNTDKWSPWDWMYAAAGGADLTNWARAVMVIEPCGEDHKTFRFIAAKRGLRVGWQDDMGNPSMERYFRHSRSPGTILWEDAEAVIDTKAAFNTKAGKEALLELMPLTMTMEKTAVISKAQSIGIGINRTHGFISELIHEGLLFESFVKRSGTRPLCLLSRYIVPENG